MKEYFNLFKREYWFWMIVMTILSIVDLVIWIVNGFVSCLVWGTIIFVIEYIALAIRFRSWTAPFTGAWAYELIK